MALARLKGFDDPVQHAWDVIPDKIRDSTSLPELRFMDEQFLRVPEALPPKEGESLLKISWFSYFNEALQSTLSQFAGLQSEQRSRGFV